MQEENDGDADIGKLVAMQEASGPAQLRNQAGQHHCTDHADEEPLLGQPGQKNVQPMQGANSRHAEPRV